MQSLTPRQMECLSYIKAHIAANGVSPTYREIGRALGIASMAPVHNLVSELAAKGRVKVHARKFRGIEVLPDPGNLLPQLLKDCADVIVRLVAPTFRVDGEQIMVDAEKLEADKAAAKAVLERLRAYL